MTLDPADKIIDDTINESVVAYNKIIKKAYRKIEKTGWPINPFRIAETIQKRFWSQDKLEV